MSTYLSCDRKQVKDDKIQTDKQKEAETKRKKYFEEKKAQRLREREAEDTYHKWVQKKVGNTRLFRLESQRLLRTNVASQAFQRSLFSCVF